MSFNENKITLWTKFKNFVHIGDTFEDHFHYSRKWYQAMCLDIHRKNWFMRMPIWGRVYISTLIFLSYFVPCCGVYCAIFTFPDSPVDQLTSLLPALFGLQIGIKATNYIYYADRYRMLTQEAIINCRKENVDPNYKLILDKYQETSKKLVKFITYMWLCGTGMFISYPLLAMNFFGQTKMYPMNFIIPGTP